jgi:hypothetical protein
MDVKNLKAYTEYGQTAARRPHFLQAVELAESIANTAEARMRQHHVSRPETMSRIIDTAWEEGTDPARHNGHALLLTNPDVMKAMTQILTRYWVYGPIFAGEPISRA